MDSERIRAEAEDIDAVVAGVTLVDVLRRNAEAARERPAVYWQSGETLRSLSWAAYRERVLHVARGLRSLGVGPGSFVAIMASNRPEHVVADLAAVHAGATPVTLYSTLAPAQIGYVAGHCEARVAIVEDEEMLGRWDKARAELPRLEHVVVLEEAAAREGVLTFQQLLELGRDASPEVVAAVDEAMAAVSPSDIATLIYTSGTTGQPKGVVISHRNVVWTTECLRRTSRLPRELTLVSYLPLAHIAERVATHYFGLWLTGSVFYCSDLSAVVQALQTARPALFVAVPRVWEKIRSKLLAKVEAEKSPVKKRLAQAAIETALDAVKRQDRGDDVPLATALRHQALDALVLAKVRAGIGLDKCTVAVSTAAPGDPEVLAFFRALGLPLVELYGMTEVTGPALSNMPWRNRIGTVGVPIAGVEVRLDEDGEILVRGGVVAGGYFKSPEDTADAFLPDGWLRTGDLGAVDGDGFFSIVGRKKELIVTAGGKNVAPVLLETLVKQERLVSQVCVVGDRRPYLTALVVLDAELAPLWAERHALRYHDLATFSEEPKVRDAIQQAVDLANAQVSKAEQIKRFAVLPAEWTPESGELTPTMKLRRKVILEKYAEQIQILYE